ncbi:class A beta-lactamase [Ruegeria sp. EL01]|uniref:class A beta-lactamase n=1 Tax=Ruegeria sp. EL01 TaxID=2107578 RepID=UPI0013C40FDD|nr:class A beta-lactamase [Ruegeria sp. EL01]
MKRRELIFGSIAAGLFNRAANADATARLESAEQRLSARIGVHAENLSTGQVFQHRPDERFAMCSTFKASLAALCLHRSDRGQLDLDERLAFQGSDILPTSSVTRGNLSAGSMSISDLCQAIVEYSDNTAANLLLKHIGGPSAITQFFRDIGDTTSRLDRTEMALNSNIAGDERDTTSPQAMARTLSELTMPTNLLSDHSRALLIQWMRNEQNGQNRIRAAVPGDWAVGNKPGTSPNGVANDIAVLWSPDGTPFVVTVFIDTQQGRAREAVAAIHDIAGTALSNVL